MRLIFALFTTLALTACATVRAPPPELSGTFIGTISDGSPVVVNLSQSEQVVTGYGTVGSTPISLSALVAPHGPALLLLEDGERMTSDIALAANGETMSMTFRGDEIHLSRGGSLPEPTAGAFQGSYGSRGLSNINVELSHSGRLVAGTGFFEGRPIAIVAHASPSGDSAEGALLFSDESRLDITARLSPDDRILTIEGAGGPLELVRR